MESSRAEFLKRELACELLPTTMLGASPVVICVVCGAVLCAASGSQQWRYDTSVSAVCSVRPRRQMQFDSPVRVVCGAFGVAPSMCKSSTWRSGTNTSADRRSVVFVFISDCNNRVHGYNTEDVHASGRLADKNKLAEVLWASRLLGLTSKCVQYDSKAGCGQWVLVDCTCTGSLLQ